MVLHDDEGHPLLATTHRGDQHLTQGAPQLLHRYEQAIDLVHLDDLVVDREGMAAEFLYQLHCEGRRVVTLLKVNQYKDEHSFTDVGEWIPWRWDREGSVVCEVASARFQLPRPTQPDQPVVVQGALIRDWLIPLNLDTNHGYAKEPVVNSELVKRRTVLEKRLAHLHRLAAQSRNRFHQMHKSDQVREQQVVIWEHRQQESASTSDGHGDSGPVG